MPMFKTTYNILVKVDENEAHEKKWFESDKLILPPVKKWDYSRELKIEDIDLWEVLSEQSNGLGLYAAWMPYAEFYLMTTSFDLKNSPKIINGVEYYHKNIETYYGKNAQKKVIKRAKELGIHLPYHKNVWVENEDMWMYSND